VNLFSLYFADEGKAQVRARMHCLCSGAPATLAHLGE
jgi:hypothetical protein